MPITVNYAPAAGMYGLTGFLAGRSKFQTDERRYQDERQQAVAQLLQNERQLRQRGELTREEMAQRAALQTQSLEATAEQAGLGRDFKREIANLEVAANRAQQMRQLQASLLSQQNARVASERMALFDRAGQIQDNVFGFQTGIADRYQTAVLNNQLDAANDMRSIMANRDQILLQQEIADREYQEKLQLAQQGAQQQRQSIAESYNRQIQAIQYGMRNGSLRQSAGARRLDQLQVEKFNAMNGVDREMHWPEGLTPKAETMQAIRNKTWDDPSGNTWVVDKDGIPRVENRFEPPDVGPDPVAEMQSRQFEMREKEYETRLKDYQSYEKEREDFYKDKLNDLITRNEERQERNESTFTPEQLRAMARGDANIYYPPRPRPQPPMMEGVAPQAPAQQPQFQGFQGAPPAAPAPQAPAAAPPEQQQQAAGVPDIPPDYPWQPTVHLSAEALSDRQEVGSFEDLTDVNGKVVAPPNLTSMEMRNIGMRMYEGTIRQVPEMAQDDIRALRELEERVRNRPKLTGIQKQQLGNSVREIRGAMAAYGPDASLWPGPVVAETAASRKLVAEELAR